MTLVVHPHLHRRRTGVTCHVETVVAALSPAFEARALGAALLPGTPRIGWGELLRRARSEAVVWHAHRNHELLVGLLLRVLFHRMRLVLTRHSVSPASRFTRWIARRAERVVALTPEVERTLGVGASIVGHGIDLARFHPAPDRAEAARALGIDALHAVGVVGRIRPDKGQGDLVEALAPLLEATPAWAGVGVGLAKPEDRPFLDSLRALSPLLRWFPEQPDIERWYRALTVLVQPSHQESFSLVLLEAMASGCCVVAARMPHYPSFIDEGRTGFLYPPGDVAALRRILGTLLANPALAERVGRAAAQEAAVRFGADHEADALGAVYRGLVARAGSA
jgi:mannosyltransferase